MISGDSITPSPFITAQKENLQCGTFNTNLQRKTKYENKLLNKVVMEKNTVPNVLKAIKENEIIFATDGSVLPILATYSWVIAKKGQNK